VVTEIIARFLLGGAIVSVFAVVGEVFNPKTFSGLFGTAPSVAIATLALAFHQHGAGYAGVEARWMIAGAAAMLVYCAACVALLKRHHRPVWLAVGVAWIGWIGAALGLFFLITS
jgi:hypothetical protein